MRRRLACLALVLAGPLLGAGAANADPASLVNPLIGTSSAVDTFPGSDYPFGMLQWSPDTSPDRIDGGGYSYGDSQISGFSLTHVSGPGCASFGDVPILPTVGALSSDPQAMTEPFSHAEESATADYYGVTLNPGSASAISTALTTAPRSGIGEFTFPATTQANLLLKLSDSAGGVQSDSAQVVGNNAIEGSVQSGYFCTGPATYTIHFYIIFDHPFASSGTWNSNSPNSNVDVNPGAAGISYSPDGGIANQYMTRGADNGLYVTFDTTSQQTVQAKVGISFVSIENARRNVTAEQPGWNFNSVHASGVAAWDKLLSKIEVSGGTPSEQTEFYTALYHSLLHPNIFSDVGGQYIGADGQVHTTAPGHVDTANYSGWDVYRDQIPLVAMLDPRYASDIVQSMLDSYKQTGMLPKWSLANGEDYIMVGDPADPMIAGAYAFGARHYDVGTAVADMYAQATKPSNIRPGLSYYEKLGYLPADGSYGCCNFYGPVATGGEYAIADAALAQMAAAHGEREIADRMMTQAQTWEDLYDPATGFLEPKLQNGQFVPAFDPSSADNYVEGNAFTYSSYVPFNAAAMIAAQGGNQAFIARLNSYFSELNAGPPMPYDWAGNEPSMFHAWYYDYAGAPYLTQSTVRNIESGLYGDTPGGVPGNDDLGAMSAWYVWAALGLYPEDPGAPDLVLGSPLFSNAVIHLAGQRQLVISAPQASDSTPYVQGLRINGQPTQQTWLDLHSVLGTAPGTSTELAYTLGSQPDTSWGAAPEDAPPSDATGEAPALLYTDPSSVLSTGAPSTATVTLAIRNVTQTAQTVSWSIDGALYGTGVGGAAAPTATPSSGTVTVAPGQTAEQPVTVATTAPGLYALHVSGTAAGKSLPASVLEVRAIPGAATVGAPGPLDQYFNSTGIAADGDPNTQADFNFDGSSATGGLGEPAPSACDIDPIGAFNCDAAYSEQALTQAGLAPGASVPVGAITYRWPDVAASQPDNIVAAGQTIPVAGRSGQSELGVLGSSTNAPNGSKGTAVVNYTDGTTQASELGLSDWTLDGGADQPAYGDAVAATLPYQDAVGEGCIPPLWAGAAIATPTASPSKIAVSVNAGCRGIVERSSLNTYLFSATVPIDPTKTVASVTLPAVGASGQMHVFAVATGGGS